MAALLLNSLVAAQAQCFAARPSQAGHLACRSTCIAQQSQRIRPAASPAIVSAPSRTIFASSGLLHNPPPALRSALDACTSTAFSSPRQRVALSSTIPRAVSVPWPAGLGLEMIVDVLCADLPTEDGEGEKWEALAEGLKKDSLALLTEAIFPPPEPTLFTESPISDEDDDEGSFGIPVPELSVVLCSDDHMRALNYQWRGKMCPTDVLSFPQDTAFIDDDALLLGDVVISVDTAGRQAAERGHTLLDEIRILLVHGVLHLLGHDHEEGVEPGMREAMAAEEARLLSVLGWKGEGLVSGAHDHDLPIHGVEAEYEGEEGEGLDGEGVPVGMYYGDRIEYVQDEEYDDEEYEEYEDEEEEEEEDGGVVQGGQAGALVRRRRFVSAPRALLLDMDGTLLNSHSHISDATAAAIRAAVAAGVLVMAATGKARVGAISACRRSGLAGADGIVCTSKPGVFLQGLQVYGQGGHTLAFKSLPESVVREAFAYSLDRRVPLIGFAGDECVTLFEHAYVDELHYKYHEPKASVLRTVDELVASRQVQKLLFMDNAGAVAGTHRPHWDAALAASGAASAVQAVPNMLEILPPGTTKGQGARQLLSHLGIPLEDVMAIGDGENDLEMVEMVGLGVAMGNAHPMLLDVADVVVGSNDEDGVAEAIYRFIID